MYLARLLGAIGRTLISAGVIVLLFVAYQLWGTGFQTDQAQKNLADDFLASIDSDAAAQLRSLTERPTAVPEADNPSEGSEEEVVEEPGVVEASFATSDISPAQMAAMYPDIGESLARVVIPAIDVDNIVVEGVRVEDLRKGPGHYDGTPMPGQMGNAAIAGHRTTYSAPFNRVDELVPGDEIKVSTVLGTFTYKVLPNEAEDGSELGYFIVKPSETWVLGQDGRNMLTLTACHPKFSARERIIVQAELVGDPVPTIPRLGGDDGTSVAELNAGGEGGSEIASEFGAIQAPDTSSDPETAHEQVISDEVAADDDPTVDAQGNPIDQSSHSADVSGQTVHQAHTGASTNADGSTSDDFGEGLDGDPTKIKPAILWGAAACSVWLCAWFIGHRLDRKILLYIIGVVPFSLVLWACFVNVDQALPSY